MAVFATTKTTKDLPPISQFTPEQRREVCEWYISSMKRTKMILDDLAALITQKIENHGNKLTALELQSLLDACNNIISCYRTLNTVLPK